MFPYADQNEDYWTGYYTSRALSKRMVRVAQANMHAQNKIYSLAALDQTTTADEMQLILDNKYQMLDIMGIMQHHDAITGTAK